MSPWYQRLPAFIDLTRLNRPIGTYLVLWPTLWALWLAAEGWPDIKVLVIFIVGAYLMRSAGCVINDFADRKVDGHVARTQNRPLATGQVSVKEALVLFFLLVVSAFILTLFTNLLTVQLSFIGVLLAFIYPFMKRFTHFPQLVLAAAFSWAIPMAVAAQTNSLPAATWLIFAANVVWTFGYDTAYAMEDRDDDLKIGVKSTAVFFGKYDRLAIGVTQLVTLVLLGMVGVMYGRSWFFAGGLLAMAGFFIWQQWLIRERQRGPCLQAFLNNNYAGLAIFIGLVLDYWLIG